MQRVNLRMLLQQACSSRCCRLALALPGPATRKRRPATRTRRSTDWQLTGTFGVDLFQRRLWHRPQHQCAAGPVHPQPGKLDNFKFTASMPYMRISGRGLVVFDASGNPIVINRRTTLPPDVRTGLGDLNLSASYTIPPAVLDDFEVQDHRHHQAAHRARRARRLSTGEADFGVSVDVSRQLRRLEAFRDRGLSDPRPARRLYALRHHLGLGRHQLCAQRQSGGRGSYDYDSADAPLVTARHELFGSLSWMRDDSITLTGYGTVGLSAGSPDIGVGLLVSYGLN